MESICALVAAAHAIGQTGSGPEPSVLDLVNLGRAPGVHAMVNGHDAILEIDTGSFELRLQPRFVQDNNLDPERVSLKIGTGPNISLKPVVQEIGGGDPGDVAAVMPARADGIVGLDVLRHYAIGIDTEAAKVCFWAGGMVPTDAANAWIGADAISNLPAKLDLHTDGEDDWFRVDARINDKRVNLVLDTGTAYSTVNPSLTKPLGLRIVGTTPVQEISKVENYKVAMADSIEFGPLEADIPVVSIENEENDHNDGILGTDSLGSGKFLIDMPALTMYARRVKQVRGNPLERRMREAGLDMFPSEGPTLRVVVRKGSLAEKKGIDSGDPLISIGEMTVAEMFSGLNRNPDPDRTNKLVSVALRALKGNLDIKVRRKDGKSIDIALPD